MASCVLDVGKIKYLESDRLCMRHVSNLASEGSKTWLTVLERAYPRGKIPKDAQRVGTALAAPAGRHRLRNA